MSKFKHFFIPHKGNNYYPHLLHTKRAVLYSGVFVASKCLIFGLTLMIPLSVFGMPDVLTEEQSRLLTLVNEVRINANRPAFAESVKLEESTENKARDMATNQYFEHTGPDGRNLRYFLKQAGYEYSAAGENLAMGFASAQDIVNAWKKSPPHYANLIDADFRETGIYMKSGLYQGENTVYTVEHFGTPQKFIIFSSPTVKTVVNDQISGNHLAISQTTAIPTPTTPSVQGEKISTVAIVPEDSVVSWVNRVQTTEFHARARIIGSVKSALVYVNQYPIRLTLGSEPFIYEGTFTAPEPSDNFFRVTISPAIVVINEDGSIITANLRWDHVKTVSPTAPEKYARARDSLSLIGGLFDISRGMYIGFAIFFTVALLLNIFIEIKKQHYHIIAQTLALILLLVSLSIA